MAQTKNLCAQIPLELHAQVCEAREQSGLTTAQYITNLLTEYFKMKMNENGGNTTMTGNTGQYADGWGESFEQHPRKTAFGDLYVKFWRHDSFFIRTGEEMETAKAPARSRSQVRREGGER